MKTIYKYLVEPGHSDITLPLGAEVLSARAIGDQVFVWAKVDTDEQRETTRTLAVYGTGHPMANLKTLRFIDTVIMYEGVLVFHVFEVAEF